MGFPTDCLCVPAASPAAQDQAVRVDPAPLGPGLQDPGPLLPDPLGPGPLAPVQVGLVRRGRGRSRAARRRAAASIAQGLAAWQRIGAVPSPAQPGKEIASAVDHRVATVRVRIVLRRRGVSDPRGDGAGAEGTTVAIPRVLLRAGRVRPAWARDGAGPGPGPAGEAVGMRGVLLAVTATLPLAPWRRVAPGGARWPAVPEGADRRSGEHRSERTVPLALLSQRRRSCLIRPPRAGIGSRAALLPPRLLPI